MQLSEEYIEAFDSISADEYFERMKSKIEQADGVAMFLLARKYEIEGRHSEAEILYAKSDVSRDEAWALDDFIAQTVSNNLDHEALKSKLFNALVTSPNEVEALWEFQLPEAPELGDYCFDDDPYCECGRNRADEQSIDVWGKPGWTDYSFEEQQEIANWIYKWYYPMACQQGMPEITYESAVDQYAPYLWETKFGRNVIYFNHDPQRWGCGCDSTIREEYGVTITQDGHICHICKCIIPESVEIDKNILVSSLDSSIGSEAALPTAEEAVLRLIRQETDVYAISLFLVEIIDAYLTNLFIEKGGPHYCKITEGFYELDSDLANATWLDTRN